MTHKSNGSIQLGHVAEEFGHMVQRITEISSSNEDLSLRLREVENRGFGGKEIFTIDEAGFFLGYTKNYLYKLVQKGAIPFHRPTGRCILFLRRELEVWVKTDGAYKGKDL